MWVLPWLWACRNLPEPVDAVTASTAETGEPAPTDTCPTGFVTTDGPLGALKAELHAAGFDVAEGRPGLLPLDGCCDWISCFKWNPSSYYGLWFLPLGPGESPEGRELDADGLQWNWRLREDEAVLMIGPTPPELRYHSYRSYVHESWDDRLGLRVPSFTSLGDTLNQNVLGTEGGAPWGATTVVLSTADATVEADLRAALARHGYPDEIVNTDVIDASKVRFGLDEQADTLRMMHRIALFEDPAAEAAWVAQPEGAVWRVTPRVPRALTPLDPRSIRVPGQGTDESAYAAALDELEAAIRAEYAHLRAADVAVNTREADPTEDCWSGCNRDALQGNTINFPFADGPDSFLVVFGVDHHATGHAAYQNAILFGAANDDPAAFADDATWAGSASVYLPGHPDADKLFAWLFSRDCAGRWNCSEVQSGCPGLDGDEPGSLHFRSYLDPVTGTAPPASEVIIERVIAFKP